MGCSVVTGLFVLSHLVLSLSPSARALQTRSDSTGIWDLEIFANDINIDQSYHYTIKFNEGTEVNLACRYSTFEAGLIKHPPILSEVTHTTKNLTTTDYSSGTLFSFLNYTIHDGEAVGGHIYRCWYREDIFIEVTVTFGNAEAPSTEAPTTEATQPPTTDPTEQPSTEAPTTEATQPPTTDPGTTDDNSSQFTGLNPLIYTISAVILLGTLAIVAIITCWIRARRSFHNRQLRPDSTPQDYLDYISDNEFTPLTTSEFLASLEQRPPTYNQSEEMESENRQNGQPNHNSDDPPTLPLRNPSQLRRLARRQRRHSEGEAERPDSSSNPAEGATTGDTGDVSTSTGTTQETSEEQSSEEQPSNDNLPTATLIEVEVNPTDVSATPTPEATLLTLDVATPTLEATLMTSDVATPTPEATLITLDVASPTPTHEQIKELDAAVEAVNERINQIRGLGNFEENLESPHRDGGHTFNQTEWENIAAHWLDT